MNNEAMKSHARAVVISGGIAECSTLYHLTREGWTDVVLVERDELTSGSTWHAAAQGHPVRRQPDHDRAQEYRLAWILTSR